MVEHYTLTLNGSAQLLSSVLPAGVAPLQAHFLSIQADPANSHVVYIGGYPQTLSSTDYGFRIEVPVSSIPSAPNIVELGSISTTLLSEWQAIGTNGEKLRICLKS